MCAELSSMIPENHGSLAWVYRGLGNYCGFIYCINDSFSTMTDIPVYIVLIGAYCKSWLSQTFSNNSDFSNDLIVYFFMVFIVLIGSILNVFDITVVGNMSILLTLIIIIPLIVGFFMVVDDINPDVWFDTNTIERCGNENASHSDIGICNWTLYFSSIIWLYTGWDTLSNVSGEVGFKLSNFLKTFIYAIIIDLFSYMIPLMTVFTIAFPKSHNYNSIADWKDGYLNTAYYKINYVLGCFVFFAGIMSNFSIHLCESCTLARELWAMAQDIAPKSKSKLELIGDESSIHDSNIDDDNLVSMRSLAAIEEESRIAIGILPKCFGYLHKRTKAPVVAIIVMFLANCVLLTFSFEFLVELGTVQNCFSFIFEYSSLIALRYNEPNEERPFKIPFGMCGVWSVTIVKFLLIGVLIVVVTIEEPYIILFCVGYNVVMTIYYFLWVKRKINKKLYNHKVASSVANLSDAEDSLEKFN